MIPLRDPESGEEFYADLSSYRFRKWFSESQAQLEQDRQEAFKSSAVETLSVSTAEDYGEALVRFFRTRGRRRASR